MLRSWRRNAFAVSAAAVIGFAGLVAMGQTAAAADTANIAVWRPSTGTWYIRGVAAVQYGRSGDVPVPADYTGDGKTDLAVWRPSTGTWYIRGVTAVQYGRSGDVPVPADYTGDHHTDIAVWRRSTATWYVRGVAAIAYGRIGDRPSPGDYMAYDRAERAVWRPSNGSWYIRGGTTVTYGRSGDVPVPGDYKDDNQSDLAVWRPSNGSWYIRGRATVPYGRSGDIPVPGRYLQPNTVNSLSVRTLTFDGADVSGITTVAGLTSMSAPVTNNSMSNLRKLFWPTGQAPSSDGQVCATWLDQSSGFVQEGVALRIVTGPSGTRALTVTKNVIYGVQWAFNVHTWDSSEAQPFTALGQYDMSQVVTANNEYQPFPWRICARVIGASLSFKVWLPDREPEPDWTDPVHAATTAVPPDYLAPGNFGWYVGHIPAGASADYGGLQISQ